MGERAACPRGAGAYDEVAAIGERIHSPELRDGRLYTISRRELRAALVNAAWSAGGDIRTNAAVAGG
ncbi:hypothetical protein HC031_09695 [Planosporangium thailandense]|uniref:Uncharacterized protein n=1 Tax=Planosporangium thailandense TaxID=765197 RepID=A0ABX0XVR4_9ACTN|nr:hypothetical protein [Planosporangium thailandense]NJC69982.1 hypothetical protein [Planosporangium thailandense]